MVGSCPRVGAPHYCRMSESSFSRLLAIAVVQGLVFGAIGGALLGSWFWKPNELQELVSGWIQNRECPCPPPRECEPPAPPAMSPQCINMSASERFMKMEPTVDDYYNKRIVQFPFLLNPQECRWVLDASKAETAEIDAALVIPRKSKSWSWLYERVHSKVLDLNRQYWNLDMPLDYNSELVEDIFLIAKTNQSKYETHHTFDIGAVGPTGKRYVSAIMILNTDFEGGSFSLLPDQQNSAWELETTQGLAWFWRSFIIKKQLPVTTGRQIALYYYIRRY